MIYLAYGPNMNTEKIYLKCSSPQYIYCGYLSGYKLVFDGYSIKRNSLVADIREDKSSKVPYVLWYIDERDEKVLDENEGYPELYDKKVIIVNGNIEATVYVMTEYKKTQRKKEYYVSKEYENTIRDAYIENRLDESFLDKALIETGNIISKSSELSITTALKKSGISKNTLASKLKISIDELNSIIKNYEKITFSQIIKISEILNCSPKDLIFTKITKRPQVFNEESLSKYFHELWFAVKWIVSIFYEKPEYYKENIDFYQNEQKALFLSGAHYYALILITELWNSSNNQDDDISFNSFFNYSLEILDKKFNKKITKIKNAFNQFKEEQKELLSRFKLSRDKTIVHLTHYQKKTITIKDFNGIPIILHETEFLINELRLVINTLVNITNEAVKIINDLEYLSLKDIKFFESTN